MSSAYFQKSKATCCKQRLDLRFFKTPKCQCNLKAEIRVVETQTKPSKGKLYYCCRYQVCNFFRWVEPERATWAPSGFPVNFHVEGHTGDEFFHGFEEHCGAGDQEGEVDSDDVVSRVSRAGGPVTVNGRGEKLAKSVNFWIGVSSVLFLLVIVMLMK